MMRMAETTRPMQRSHGTVPYSAKTAAAATCMAPPRKGHQQQSSMGRMHSAYGDVRMLCIDVCTAAGVTLPHKALSIVAWVVMGQMGRMRWRSLTSTGMNPTEYIGGLIAAIHSRFCSAWCALSSCACGCCCC